MGLVESKPDDLKMGPRCRGWDNGIPLQRRCDDVCPTADPRPRRRLPEPIPGSRPLARPQHRVTTGSAERRRGGLGLGWRHPPAQTRRQPAPCPDQQLNRDAATDHGPHCPPARPVRTVSTTADHRHLYRPHRPRLARSHHRATGCFARDLAGGPTAHPQTNATTAPLHPAADEQRPAGRTPPIVRHRRPPRHHKGTAR